MEEVKVEAHCSRIQMKNFGFKRHAREVDPIKRANEIIAGGLSWFGAFKFLGFEEWVGRKQLKIQPERGGTSYQLASKFNKNTFPF